MKLGIAGLFPNDFDRIEYAAKLGYDFIESGLSLLHAEYTDADVRAFADYTHSLGLPIVSTNGMFPGYIKLIGKEVDRPLIENYLHEAFSRIEPLHTEVCVLGSAAARTVADGYDKDRAYAEFAETVGDIIAPIVESYGKVLAIEPLNRNECNIVNTVAESMRVVRAVGKPSVRTLIDFYHVGCNGENVESFIEYGTYIEHVHIASAKNARRYPKPFDGENYRGFFDVLRKANYARQTVSIEGAAEGFVEFCNSARAAYDLLKSC